MTQNLITNILVGPAGLERAHKILAGVGIKIGAAAGVATIEQSAPEAWVAPTLLNSWVNLGAPYATAGYYLDGHLVRLRGVVASGAVGQDIFLLPSGYRPEATALLQVISNNQLGLVSISSAGAVELENGSSSWLSLDGLSFRVV